MNPRHQDPGSQEPRARYPGPRSQYSRQAARGEAISAPILRDSFPVRMSTQGKEFDARLARELWRCYRIRRVVCYHRGLDFSMSWVIEVWDFSEPDQSAKERCLRGRGQARKRRRLGELGLGTFSILSIFDPYPQLRPPPLRQD